MRVSRRAIDSDSLAWQQLSDVLYCKMLNGQRESGPHTMLLRSEPRVPAPHPCGQYHPVDEEFFCLGGDFTFDGSTWFRDGSYAFYPANFVHGTKVHVRGGYEVYLRLSGANQVSLVDKPISDIPYYVGEGECSHSALQLTDASAAEVSVPGMETSALQVRPLRTDSRTGEGSTLLTTTRGSPGQVIRLETAGLLEMFVLSGEFTNLHGERLHARAYHCEIGDNLALGLQCDGAGSLIISHGGELHVG